MTHNRHARYQTTDAATSQRYARQLASSHRQPAIPPHAVNEDDAMFKITLTIVAIAFTALAAVNASAHFLQPCIG